MGVSDLAGKSYLTCSWVREWWEDPRGDGLREELKGMGVKNW
jgi:hypothetical protein